MERKYLVDGECLDPDKAKEVDETFPMSLPERVTGAWLAEHCGIGVYTTHRPDGQAIRIYRIRLNRKGTLSIDTEKATGVEALSNINLERLIKRLDAVAKIWPAGVAKQTRQVEAEHARRVDLVDRAMAKQMAVLVAEEAEIAERVAS